MRKGIHKMKLGRFGWAMFTVIIVTIIGSVVFFLNVFNLELGSIVDGEGTIGSTKQGDLSDEAKGEISRVRQSIGADNEEVGKFVAEMHNFYNETTGYGGINNLDWDEQREQAQSNIKIIEEMKPGIEEGQLIVDLDAIIELARGMLDEEDSSIVRGLHRYFHDLDIALNDYGAYDRIWNVTETLSEIN